jgi:hypothetical protein
MVLQCIDSTRLQRSMTMRAATRRAIRRSRNFAVHSEILSIQDTLHCNEPGLAISLMNQSQLGWEQKTRNRFYVWGIEGGTMMLFLIIGTLAGVLLGLRFKVFVLVPFILIIACAIIATGHGLKAIALTILATAVLFQIGYILGLVVRVWAGRYLRRRKILRYQPSKSKSVVSKGIANRHRSAVS